MISNLKTNTIFFLLLITFNIFSQNKTILSEDQFEDLKSKVKLQARNNLDSAYYYCNEIEDSDNKLHKAFATSYKAYFSQIKGDTISSNEYMQNAFMFLKNEKKSIAKNKINNNFINTKFRDIKKEFEIIMSEGSDYRKHHLIYKQRNAKVKTILNTLLMCNEKDVYFILSSYLHMTINRLFENENRWYEYLTYSFLLKYLKSTKARIHFFI